MPQTILYFIDSKGFGGTEQMLLTLLAGLDRSSWRPVLACHPNPGIAPLVERARGFDVKIWETPQVQENQGLAWVLRFARELRALRPAVFHAHLNWPMACTHGLAAAALARIPAIIATQQLFAEINSRRSLIRQKLLSIWIDRYIAVSNDVAGRLRATCMFSSGKVQVIHNGIPLTSFDRPVNRALRASLTQDGDRPVVLTLARLEKQKGLPYLLEAAAMVPEAVFVVAGEGSERASLEAQATELGVAKRVLFLGQRDDIPELLACCDLFILPSLNEGLPISVLEAMGAGKPVIASAIGGTDEAIIHGETGLLVPPRSPAALAEAIRTLLNDPTLCRRLATAGKARVAQEFSAETIVQRTMKLYDELLSSRNGRGDGSHNEN